MKVKKITKAVIPVAGFGTRLLPITKTIPKEMLPVGDKPILQLVVEELVSAEIKEIILIVSGYKKALEDYFQPFFELEVLLEKAGKTAELEEIRRLSNLAKFIFVRQKEMRGTGDAILTAEPAVGNEPFVVSWGDDLLVAKPSRTKQLLAAFAKYQACILGATKTKDPEDGMKYGFAIGDQVEKGLVKIENIIEKPGFGKAPSQTALVSGFVFTPDIFPGLKEAQKEIGDKRELLYIDGLLKVRKAKPIYALEIKNSQYFDTGNKLAYYKTFFEFVLKDRAFGVEFKKFARKAVK